MSERKVYDFDQAFDERIGAFMKKKKGKFTEEEWEDIIGEQYKKFSETVIEKFGCTPVEYYSRMSKEELKEELHARFAQKVNIDGFLRAAAEEEKNRSVLFDLLNGNEEEAIFAVTVLGDQKEAYADYLSLLCRTDNELLQGELTEILKEHADELAEELVKLYRSGAAGDCIADILSRCSIRREDVYGILIESFRISERPGEAAERLAYYGDERAVAVISERLEEPVGYNDWHGMKYAAESLGGKVSERDFSGDRDYIKVKEEEARLEAERESATGKA